LRATDEAWWLLYVRRVDGHAKLDESTRTTMARSRFARRPPALHQIGGAASDDGVRVRHRRDAE